MSIQSTRSNQAFSGSDSITGAQKEGSTTRRIKSAFGSIRYDSESNTYSNTCDSVYFNYNSDGGEDSLKNYQNSGDTTSRTLTQFDIDVPNLDLQSISTSRTTLNDFSIDNATFSTRKIFSMSDECKMDAHKKWLSAKRHAKQYEKQKEMAERRQKEEEEERKKSVAREKVREWMEKKQREQRTLKEKDRKFIDPDNGTIQPLKINEVNRKSNYDAWLKRKIQQQQLNKRAEDEKMKSIEEKNRQRKEKARQQYDKWLETVPMKPRPVPLNRGLLSLKGSISDMYINPMPWQSIISTEDNTKSL